MRLRIYYQSGDRGFVVSTLCHNTERQLGALDKFAGFSLTKGSDGIAQIRAWHFDTISSGIIFSYKAPGLILGIIVWQQGLRRWFRIGIRFIRRRLQW